MPLVDTLSQLQDNGLSVDVDLLELSYRFAGELVDVEQVLERARAAA